MDLIKKALILCGAILTLVIAAPAFAQYSGQGYYVGPGEAGCGADDNKHRWHDATWWHWHYIEWFYAVRQEWAAMDALWLTTDGEYDNTNNWHDPYRWHQSNPDSFDANHPHRISGEPSWRDQDAAYGWQYGQWWYIQNPNWVSTNHSNWISEHRNGANHSEPLDHRAVTRTENEGNQRIPQQQQVSIQQNQVNQQNSVHKAAVICVFLLALGGGLSP